MFGLIHRRQVGRTAAATPRGGRRPWFREAMHWVRRIHLYSGLFMFPWVMLYGITALLFNHPGVFRDQPRRVLGLRDFEGTPLRHVADPAADAEQVVAALNTKFASSTTALPLYRLIHPDQAKYTRDRILARVRGEGQEHSVVLDLASGVAQVSTDPQGTGERAPFGTRGLKVGGSLAERVKTGLPAALARQGLAAEEAGIAIGTELVFYVEAEGRAWRATYNIQTGAVTGAPAHRPGSLLLRDFLTQLHVTHGYPSHGGAARWFWALAVDAMFASMVFWGVSGLLMSWQIKAVRSAGAIVVAVSLMAATVLAFAMYRLFTV